jgi:CRP-like cAMP-binding protein
MRPIEKTFRKGEVIIKEGRTGKTFYVIQQGMVEVIKRQDDRDIVITVLGPNEFFGEMSLLDPNIEKRSATIRAVEDTTVKIMDKEDFERYLGKLPPGVQNLLSKLVTRLRETNTKLEMQAGRKRKPKADVWTGDPLTLDELQTVREHSVDINFLSKKFRAGQTLLREGERGQCGFLVKKGELEVSKTVEGRKVVLSHLGEHDIVGESALFSDIDRDATVTALTDGELLVFGKRDVINMTRQSPLELFMIMDSMSVKLDRLNEAYCKSLVEKDDSGRKADQMSKLVDELKDKIRLLENEKLELKQRLSRSQNLAEGPDTAQST